MAPRASRVVQVAVGYGVLAVLAGLVAVPLWLSVEPVHRPVVVRLAAAGMLAVALGRVVVAARRRIDAQEPSGFDRAMRAVPVEASIPRDYRELAEELHFARMSHGYWSRVLQPRLAALAARLPGAPAPEDLPRAALRRWLGLGPSLAALRGAIDRLERRG